MFFKEYTDSCLIVHNHLAERSVLGMLEVLRMHNLWVVETKEKLRLADDLRLSINLI